MRFFAAIREALKKKRDEMKIYHTTYEESRRGGTTVNKSTPERGKGLFSSKNYDDGHTKPRKEGRPMTAWPSPEKGSSANTNVDMTTFLTQKRQQKKASQKADKVVSSANSTGLYVPLKGPKPKESEPMPPAPTLRHKEKFSSAQLKRQANESEHRELREKESFANLKKFQDAMRTGKIERVVPPKAVQPWEEGRLAPPRAPLTVPATTTRKTKNSSSAKAAGYIGTSADVLDETRREIASKFRPSFEHLSSSLTRSTSASSSSSSYSFVCQGESSRSQKNVERLSGEGTDPWDPKHSTENCRLCRRPGVEGVTGLCEDCEKEFKRMSSDDEVKPIPPLKDRKILALKRDEKNGGRLVSHSNNQMEEVPRISIKKSANKTTLVTPLRQESQRAVIVEDGIEDEDVVRMRRREKAEYDRIQNTFERLSKTYGSGDEHHFAVETEDDLTPLLAPSTEERRPNTLARRTAFYGFWDDLMPEFAAKK